VKHKKHKPARPHWERIAEKRANGKIVVITKEDDFYDKRTVRPSNSTPGQ